MDDPPKDPSIDDETPCLTGMGSRDMPFEWNINALRHYYIPPNLLGYSKLRTLLIHLGSWPVGKHEQSRDHTIMDDEAPCSNGMGSRDMPFEWNSNAFRKCWPFQALFCVIICWKDDDDPPKDPSIDDETLCLSMGSRDMPFEWNSSALRHYIPPNLLGYSKLRTLLVHLGSWPVGKHERPQDHTNNRWW